MSGRALRVVSYNVRQFVADTTSSVDGFLQEVLKLEPHVVCLNEVDIQRWPSLEAELRGVLGNLAFYGHARNGRYGNAILSSLPLEARCKVPLEGGSKLEYPPGSGKVHHVQRGLLVAEVDASQLGLSRIAIATTHLDHISEDERRTQLEHVVRVLDGVAPLPVVLCGDLNSFSRDDYTPEEWERLEARHALHGWAPPRHGALRLLEHRAFVDAFVEANACSGGARALKWTGPVGDPMYRIDYCFCCSRLRAALRPAQAWVHQEAALSDHFPVVVDFEPVPPPGAAAL